MLVSRLKMTNTIWAMLLPAALSVYNMILVRTFLTDSILHELLEASQIDGCSDARYFTSVPLPLSKPVIAVITLYYAVGYWNSHFNAMIYLNDVDMYRAVDPAAVLVAQPNQLNNMVNVEAMAAKQGLSDVLK